MANVGNSNIIFIDLSIDDKLSDDSSQIEVINPENLKVLCLKVRHLILKFVDIRELVDARDLNRNVVEEMKPAELRNLENVDYDPNKKNVAYVDQYPWMEQQISLKPIDTPLIVILIKKYGYNHSHLLLLIVETLFYVDNVAEMVRRRQQDLKHLASIDQYPWMEQYILLTTFIFSDEHTIENSYQDVGMSSDWPVLHIGQCKMQSI